MPNITDLQVLNDDERKFQGWLSVEVVDKQGEIIPIDELVKVMDTMMSRGGFLTDSHSNRVIGKVLNWQRGIKNGKSGIKVTAKVFKDYKIDDIVWNKIKSKEYGGLSFGGSNEEKEFKNVGGKPAGVLSELEGYEVAVCASPANEEATITAFNPLAKSDVEKTETDIIKAFELIIDFANFIKTKPLYKALILNILQYNE